MLGDGREQPVLPGAGKHRGQENTELGSFLLIPDLFTLNSIKIPSNLLEIPQGKFHIYPLAVTWEENFSMVGNFRPSGAPQSFIFCIWT